MQSSSEDLINISKIIHKFNATPVVDICSDNMFTKEQFKTNVILSLSNLFDYELINYEINNTKFNNSFVSTFNIIIALTN